MELTAWGITHARYADSAFDGEGARLYGGRFNRRGTAVVYLSSTLSLAMLELLVHLDRGRALSGLLAIPVTFDSDDVLRLEERSLPQGWNAPVPPQAVQEIGEQWVRSMASVLLRVQSALLPDEVVEREHNYLLNPRHRHVSRLDIGVPARLPSIRDC